MAQRRYLRVLLLCVFIGLLLGCYSTEPSSNGPLADVSSAAPPPPGAELPNSVVLSSTGNSLGPSSSAIISAAVKDEAGNPLENLTVTFSIISGTSLGTLNPPSSATNANGIATTTFTSGTSTGLVQIQGVVPVQSATIQSGVLLLSISNIGSVQLVEAVPPVIGVQGSGQVQSSTVTFMVVDQLNNPVPDTTLVSISISGPGGGETIFPTETHTSNGLASVVITSGTKAGPVTMTVIAQLGPTSISNTMTPLSIGGGVPDQKHLSLGTTIFNLGAGAPAIDHLDVTTTLECKMGDLFGSSNILQGTSASFYTEAAVVEAANATAGPDGIARVTLRTQDPPPDVVSINSGRHPENGRVTIMCETGGQEYFNDNNSNGIFDSGDTFSTVQDDITEPFLDRNEDGTRNPPEYFDDVNQTGIWDAGNGKWDANTKVWAWNLIVFSGFPQNIEMANATSSSAVICVSDYNGNAIMGKSTVEFSVPPPNTIVIPGAGQSEPNSSATVTIPDQLYPNINPQTGEPAGTCFTVFPSSGGINMTAFVTWKVPGFSDQLNSRTFTLP
jgi:Bacterial Ig-like domain (group 1)